MKVILIFLFAITSILFGCSEIGEKKQSQSKEKKVENVALVKDSVPMETKEIDVNKNGPIPEIVALVKEIEKSDWIPDTLRLRKKRLYSHLGDKVLFNSYPFYKIDFQETALKRTYDDENDFLRKRLSDLDIKLFGNVKSIWGYFYRKKDAQKSIPDGVIEQWEFENEVNAEEALRQIQPIGRLVHFNTRPYYYRVRNYLITFHTRAMGYSYDQEEIFEKLRKKTSNSLSNE